MRRGNKPSVQVNDNGELVAVNLSADFCAEHEWGVKMLFRDLGVPGNQRAKDGGLIERFKAMFGNRDIVGLDASQVTEFDRKKFIHQTGTLKIGPSDKRRKRMKVPYGLVAFGMSPWFCQDKTFEEAEAEWKNGELDLNFYTYEYMLKNNEYPMVGAWSESDFGVLMTGEEGQQYARDLMDAFERKDVCLLFGRSLPVFENPGLILAIRSRLEDADEIDQKLAADTRNKWALEDRVKEIGIVERIDQFNKEKGGHISSFGAPCGYFALSPSWRSFDFKPGGKQPNTEYDVIFFLNPRNQSDNNFGWFTVEDLELWMNGEGPIPKKNNV